MQTWSLRIGSVFGISLEVHVTFLLLALWVGYAGWGLAGALGLIWSMLFLVSIFGSTVLHELGHSMTARHYGIPTHAILLLPVGGVAQLGSIPRNPIREILITLAGPAVNFAIVALLLPFTGFDWSWWGAGLPLSWQQLAHALIVVNLVMGLFNFLPIFPMDGGRILRALLALRMNYLHATRFAAHSGKVLAVLAIGYVVWRFETFGPLPIVLFALVFIGGDLEYRSLKRREQLAGFSVGQLTRKRHTRLPADATITEVLDTIVFTKPQDVLLMDNERPVGVLTLERLRTAAENGCHADPARHHAIAPVQVLQAEWPLEFVDMTIRKSPQHLFPVYCDGHLLGVVDSRTYEESVDWLRLIRRVQHMPPLNPEPFLDR
jgi:Zn-dependent protease